MSRACCRENLNCFLDSRFEILFAIRHLVLKLVAGRVQWLVRALASHQCGPGLIPWIDAICGLSLLLVLVLAPRGFSPGAPVFLTPQKPTFQIPLDLSGSHGHLWTSPYRELFGAPWVNKLNLQNS